MNRFQCPRCPFGLMLEVHGHYQCRSCTFVAPCCSGELELEPCDLMPPISDAELIAAVRKLPPVPEGWFVD